MDKKIQNRIKVVIIAIASIVMSKNAIALIIANLIANFPNQSAATCQLVFTSISGISVIGALLFGVLSTKITKKNLAVLFLSSVLCGSIVALLFGEKSIALLFLSSGLIGIGLGLLPPLLASTIAEYFPTQEERAGANGLQAFSLTTAAIFYPIIGGYLTATHWTYDYFLFFISIPIILLVLIVMPKGQVESGLKMDTGEKVKVWTPGLRCWVFELFILGISWITFNTSITSVLRGLGIPNFVKVASYVILSFSVASLIAAFLLKKMCKIFGKNMMTYGLGLVTIGLFLLYFCQRADLLWLAYTAGALIGLGFSMFFSGGNVFIPQSIDRRAISKGLSFFAAANVLGTFINPYVITATAALINKSIYTRFLLAGSLCLVGTIFAFATKKYKQPKQTINN